ncbi:hypothetical protein QTG54_002655 [Skeletonema marinoi]|uniref:Uncharacterized protein n=1 Tax=Skeletonema marinoi TaxID=267567 RepID=A0AAD8YGV6_9STRA|nr:hypothetical protein QTG54_002655 [Skeletonema marinoi]
MKYKKATDARKLRQQGNYLDQLSVMAWLQLELMFPTAPLKTHAVKKISSSILDVGRRLVSQSWVQPTMDCNALLDNMMPHITNLEKLNYVIQRGHGSRLEDRLPLLT